MDNRVDWAQEVRGSERIIDGPVHGYGEVESILEEVSSATSLKVDIEPVDRLKDWSFRPDTGNLAHDGGRFFTIEGVMSDGNASAIINQPEIGILGFIAKSFEGVVHFLFQIKAEPGNVGGIQLSPTVQATKSNYTRAHGGKIPHYLDFFMGERRVSVIADQFQSEQGCRYFKKRNRNTILWTDEPVDEARGFIRLTAGQVRKLYKKDYLINSCARSILSCLPAEEEPSGKSLYSDVEALSRLRQRREDCPPQSALIPLKQVGQWSCVDGVLRNTARDEFEVIGVRVAAGNREVATWSQPLIRECKVGEYGSVVTLFGGIPHWLVRFSREPGHRDGVEWGPAWIVRDYSDAGDRQFWDDLASRKPGARVACDTWFSEEGGRFFQTRFKHRALFIPGVTPEETPADYLWLSSGQVRRFLRHSNNFTMEFRSLCSCYEDSWVGA